jgi:hypothetical protein
MHYTQTLSESAEFSFFKNYEDEHLSALKGHKSFFIGFSPLNNM